MRWLPMILLVGCTTPDAEGIASFEASEALVADRYVELAEHPEAADAPILGLLLEEGAWQATLKDKSATWDVWLDDGLWLDDVKVLPDRVEGLILEYDTWYGTFPRAAEVEIDEGRFAGPAVFAPGYGPLVLTVDGDTYELVWYEFTDPTATDLSDFP